MPQTVDIEITSATTARATLADADVAPMELEASEDKAIGVVVHEFLRTLAKEEEGPVDVVYRTKKEQRFLSVDQNGKTEIRTPSIPMPVVDRGSVAAPTVVTAEEIAHYQAPQGAQERPIHTPPSVDTRPSDARVTGPLGGVSQLSAPSMDLVSAEPARAGARGRLNRALGLKLAPKPTSAEMRHRTAASAVAGVIPDFSVITVVNPKGGVGKTPLALGLVSAIARHRGAGTVVCADLAETAGSLTDRVSIPPHDGQHVLDFLAAVERETGVVRPSVLARYLVRQPDGSDIIAGVPEDAALGFEDSQSLARVLSHHRELLVADTGNTPLAGSWQWAVKSAGALVVPVPLRRDAAARAHRMLLRLVATNGTGALARTIVVITDGPGDAPMVETEAVRAFEKAGVRCVARMPFEPLFASGERIVANKLKPKTSDALDVLAAMVIGLIAGRPTN